MDTDRQQPLGKTADGRAVKYRSEFYPTELARIVPYISDPGDDSAAETFEDITDQRLDAREVVIWWDKSEGKIEKCVMDGEEFPVEEG